MWANAVRSDACTNASNRTFEVLKSIYDRYLTTFVPSSNRTFEVLKYTTASKASDALSASNRTFEVLKFALWAALAGRGIPL